MSKDPTEYDRFMKLAKVVITAPKAQVDALAKEEKRKRAEKASR